MTTDPGPPADQSPDAPAGWQQWAPPRQRDAAPMPAAAPPSAAAPPTVGVAGPAPTSELPMVGAAGLSTGQAAGRSAAAARAARAAVPVPPPGSGSGRPTPDMISGVTGSAAAASTPAAASGSRIRPRRVRPGTGPFAIGQLVYWQLAATVLLAAYQRGPVVALVTAAALALLLAPTVVRLRGRWLYQWMAVWLRYRLRPRRLPAGGGNRAAGLLRFVEPTAMVDDVTVSGRTMATISHRGGVCAVLELDPADGSLFVGSALSLPSPAALLPAADPAAPPISVQLLVQVAAAPRAHTGRGLVERSYRELTGGDVPARRRAWLVLQVMRTPDGYTDRELAPALVSSVRRVQRQLKQDRVPARLLGGDELLAAVGYLAQLPSRQDGGNVYGTASNRVAGEETWQAWWSGEVPQVCRRLLRWPELPWQLDDVLRQLPMVDTVVSVAVAREPGHPTETAAGDVTVSAAVRLTAADVTTLAAGDQALTDAVRERGGLTERIDGEHVRGLAATLPLGGFLP
ncbi:type VII secretion protein EccE [Micromonospora sp. Llam0]|uniref:type VII secretion protein EccE n=1 Tax=Micromonospora sp. Llam0 TaxID=2485143 RepID=UPI000F4A56F2|nr:type VII secretion protein EccE [Micromonospora sp. Llam0]